MPRNSLLGMRPAPSTIAQPSDVWAKTKVRANGPEELKQPIIDTLEEASHGRATTALDGFLDVKVAVPKGSDDQSLAENPWFVCGSEKVRGVVGETGSSINDRKQLFIKRVTLFS